MSDTLKIDQGQAEAFSQYLKEGSEIPPDPLITNDAVVLGILLTLLAFIFQTSNSGLPFWKRFYTYVPPLLLCYFLPALLNWPFNLVDGEVSGLYHMASRYLLPASLALLCLNIDFQGIFRLGPKMLIMFLTATLSIMIGGPLALYLTSLIWPELIQGQGPEAVWRGLTTVAGTWIGGGANQTAMKEIFQPSNQLFTAVVVVDVLVANIWMGFLLYGSGISDRLDQKLKADNSAIQKLKHRISEYQEKAKRIPSFPDLMNIVAIGLGATAIAHFGADVITPFMKDHAAFLDAYNLQSLKKPFLWIMVIATTLGILGSFTRFKDMEGAGASKVGSLFLYVLVAAIGMHMNLIAIKESPKLFVIGFTWMAVHVVILLTVAKLIKAPYFFIAVGSQANIGGAASAPIVASSFSPSLAPVGVLIAVLGYALGTYGAVICAELMRWVAGG
ncbi:MAG: DUF819 domain-containing protein [Flavobacteriales bacterium]